MTTLVSAADLERIAFDHPSSTIEPEYAGDVEIRRHLTVGRTHYVANVVCREVTLAEVKRAVRP